MNSGVCERLCVRVIERKRERRKVREREEGRHILTGVPGLHGISYEHLQYWSAGPATLEYTYRHHQKGYIVNIHCTLDKKPEIYLTGRV